jgi:two-component system response regulator MprA
MPIVSAHMTSHDGAPCAPAWAAFRFNSADCREHGQMTASTIAICVADLGLRNNLSDVFARHGFVVSASATAEEVMQSIADTDPAILLLELALPDGDGRDVCQALRANRNDVPVLFIGALGTLDERLSSFHAGGDGYLSKPFSTAELLARTSALTRRRVRAAYSSRSTPDG